MRVSFYARGSVVQARISNESESYRISTGIKIEPHHKFSGEFKGKSVEVAQLNAELSRCRTKLTELYVHYKDFKLVKEHFVDNEAEVPEGETYLLHELLLKYVKMMGTGEVLSFGNKRYSPATVKIYRYVSNLLVEFTNFHYPIDIREFHIEPSWESFRKREVADRYSRYWKKYEDYLTDREVGIRSRRDVMNITSVIATYWANHLFFTLPKLPRLTSHEKAIIVLPYEFVKRFLNDEDRMYDKLTPELKFIWEISATMLITTLRVGDAMSLTERDLVLSKEGVFLRKKNEKTGAYSEMPLPKRIADIYRDNLARHGRVYTVVPTKDLIYDNMRKFFKMYDDMHEMISAAEIDHRGNERIVTKPYYEWVHPHLLRKTAITTMIYNKVPERFIKFASGHSKNSPAFERYVGHVEKYYRSEISDYYGKIFE